jgi:hypothetical protein
MQTYTMREWWIGKTYWSLHDKIPPRKYEEIRKVVKRRLGVLPSEMAKDDESAARQTKDVAFDRGTNTQTRLGRVQE